MVNLKKNSILLFFILVFAVIFLGFVYILMSQEHSQFINDSEDIQTEFLSEDNIKEPIVIYRNLGEIVNTSKIQAVALSVRKVKTYENIDFLSGIKNNITAFTGRSFVFVELEIKNIGNRSFYLNSVHFNLTTDEYVYEPEIYIEADSIFDKNVYKEVEPNKTVKGMIVFQVHDIYDDLSLLYGFSDILDEKQFVSWKL